MKDFFFLIVGIAVIAASFYAFLQKPAPERYQKNEQFTINNLQLEIADTDAERILGLSGRESLPAGMGLLFVFEEPGMHGFWMKDMKFAIDIIWLGENYEVLGIEKNVSPQTYPEVFYPPQPVKYVLETNPGEIVVLESN